MIKRFSSSITAAVILLLCLFACSRQEETSRFENRKDSNVSVVSSEPVTHEEKVIEESEITKTKNKESQTAQILNPLSTTAICENNEDYIYCVGEGMPVVEGSPDLYGQLIDYSPEFFCASDLDIRLCEDATEAMLHAANVWGNYGPIEYWIVGIDENAGNNLIRTYCNRRMQRNNYPLNDCLDRETNRDHGMNEYRQLSAQWLAEKIPASSMGHNGGREFNYHKFISSVPWGFDSSYNLFGQPTATGDQTIIFHEYFHAVQHSALPTKDWHVRDAGLDPRWFTEGAAEYMAQAATKHLRSINAMTFSEIGRVGEYDFYLEMENKLTGMKEDFNRCGGSLPDTDYGEKCDSYEGAYSGGAWAHAYLAAKYGSNILLDIFYPNLEILGFAEAFNFTYGQSVEDFYIEFDQFLELPQNEQLAMLP